MSEQKRTHSATSWDDLRVFLALARLGQLTEAARHLGTSHVTVARRMDRLEAALNQRLFTRNARGYDLTPAGRKLVSSAERMEAAAGDLHQDRGESAGLSGVLRLAFPEAFGSYFAQHLTPRFLQHFPGILPELITMTQVMPLSRREADLSVTVDPAGSGPYRSEKLLDYDLRIYGARSYLGRSTPISSRHDLSAHPFIGYIEGMIFSQGLDYLDEIHRDIRPVLKGSSIFNQLSATRQGLGLCVLPCYIARAVPDLAEVLPDQITLRRSYWLTCHRDALQMRRERLVARFLHESLAADQAAFINP